MAKVSKMDAFALVIEAAEKGDEKTANEILKIIYRSISKESSFSNEIEIKNKRDEKYFKKIMCPVS